MELDPRPTIEIKQALALLSNKALTSNSKKWSWLITSSDPQDDGVYEQLGATVAHLAAYTGIFPNGFNYWFMRDRQGRTVIETSILYNLVPDSFTDWDVVIRDNGLTVAHVAALYYALPANFDRWDIKTATGVSVLALINADRPKRLA